MVLNPDKKKAGYNPPINATSNEKHSKKRIVCATPKCQTNKLCPITSLNKGIARFASKTLMKAAERIVTIDSVRKRLTRWLRLEPIIFLTATSRRRTEARAVVILT